MIFLKSHKTAGTSLEIALSRFAQAEDVVTPIVRADEKIRNELGFRGPQNYRVGVSEALRRHPLDIRRALATDGIDCKYWRHMPSASVRRALGREVWDSCERITIMRNPFDKIVSWFFWNQREFLKNNHSEKEIVTDFFPSWFDSKTPTFLADRKIYLLNGLPAMTQYLKYETISDELQSLELDTGFPGLQETFASVRAKTGLRPKWATRQRFFSESLTMRKK